MSERIELLWAVLGVVAAVILAPRVYARWRLSKAKHPSLQGHSRWAQRIARLVPFYEYDEARFFDSDGAPADVADMRRAGFERLAQTLSERAPASIVVSEHLRDDIPDLEFTALYRVPFQYRRYVDRHLRVGSVLQESTGVLVKDLDGNLSYDLTGSYGVNVFGHDFYKACIDAGADRVRRLGPVLGSYHPLIADNVRRLKEISGLDQVSFHMSGTEAVMQAVRLARYHTGRPRLVRFCGAYHGWWDDVQPGIGTPKVVHDVFTLKDMHGDSLAVLRSRRDIACVLVNPLQALHPNAGAPGDASLVSSDRTGHFNRNGYSSWLRQLRTVCTESGIVLIFDEVFMGFRLARGGAQEYFGVAADMVTYGKTLGGGLPVGVVCGRRDLMKRFRPDRPADICFARGTFNSHPYVMGAMDEFLRRLDEPEVRDLYANVDTTWNDRARSLNARLSIEQLPVRVANLSSVWTICFVTPCRYNWMFQYYLRAAGLALSWVGSGRLIFSLNYTSAEFEAVAERFVGAARAMRADAWWWTAPALTNRAIKRHVLREMVAVRLGWRAEGRAMRLDHE